MSMADSMPRQRAATALLVLIITAFAAVLRLRGLGNDSLWLDEVVTWTQTRSGVIDAIIATSRDTYPPGYNVLTAIAVSLFGEAEWVLRLPAAIAGTLTVPAAYGLGRLAAGRSTGLVAALMVALSSFAIYYSQEARMYALLMLSATLTTAAAMAYVARPSIVRGLIIAASATLLLYSQPYGALSWLVLGGTSFVLLLARQAGARPVLGVVVAFGSALLLFTPWLFVTLGVARNLQENGFWIGRPNWLTAVSAFAFISGSWAQLLFVVAGGLLSLLYWLRPAAEPPAKHAPVPKAVAATLLLASAFGPWLAGLVISLVATPVFLPRYLICCLPALLALSAIGYAHLAGIGRRGLAASCVLMTVWLVLGPSVDDDDVRNGQNARALAAELNYVMQPQDCLYIAAFFQRVTLDYYLREPPACDLTGTDPASLSAVLPAGARLFFVAVGDEQQNARELESTLGGTWSTSRAYGYAMRLSVREPS